MDSEYNGRTEVEPGWTREEVEYRRAELESELRSLEDNTARLRCKADALLVKESVRIVAAVWPIAALFAWDAGRQYLSSGIEQAALFAVCAALAALVAWLVDRWLVAQIFGEGSVVKLQSHHVTIIVCVTLACITLVVCCWLMRPYRYVHASGRMVLDKQTGELIIPPVK